MIHPIPDFSLVLLVGAAGSGKSAFAARHFHPTEVVSSDECRSLASDDRKDPSIGGDAFAPAHATTERRLQNRRLAVVDATNLRAADRRPWIEIARRWHAQPVAIVLAPRLELSVERNRLRPDRQAGPQVPKEMDDQIRKGLRDLEREGFRQVILLRSPEEIEAAEIRREPLRTDRRSETGPFDIIGDVHGCGDELEALLGRLGYAVAWSLGEGGRVVRVTPPEGRRVVFVGDLVDRGPRTPDVLRIAMAMVEAGQALVVEGNHENKLARWLAGRNVKIGHGLQETIDQLSAEPDHFRGAVKCFLEGLRSHAWLDGGRLCVAHAGLTADLIGRGSGAVRAFALYGETSGEIDAFGLPVRADWAAGYRGETTVVYGHVPRSEAEWVNNTLCIDTGCVFGGKLTALRWPERDLVSVPALRTWFEPLRPLAATPPS